MGISRKPGRAQDKNLKGSLIKPSDIQIDRAKEYSIPLNLRQVHAYDRNAIKLAEFNATKNMQINNNLKGKLYKKRYMPSL